MLDTPTHAENANAIETDPTGPLHLVFGRNNPLSRLLAEQLREHGGRVVVSALPTLDVTGASPPAIGPAPVLWLPGNISGELPADCAEGDMKSAARRVAEAAVFLRVQRVVVATDFSIGECEHYDDVLRDITLRAWRHWTKSDLEQFLETTGTPAERRRFTAYFSLIQQLEARQLPYLVVHTGALSGDSRDGCMENNPALDDFFSAIHSGTLRVRPGNAELWVPMCAPDFAAAFIARLPLFCAPGEGTLWLYDRRALSARWMVEELSRLMGREPPWLALPSAMLESLGRSGLARTVGQRHGLHRLTRRSYDNHRELELAQRMGLVWPDSRRSLSLTVAWWLAQRSGQPPAALELPGRSARLERRQETPSLLPRHF